MLLLTYMRRIFPFPTVMWAVELFVVACTLLAAHL